jgi:cytochrome oxidase Cu insertion factor (SCO1/SenC/PrrC family)
MLRAMLRTLLALVLVGCGGAASTAPPATPPATPTADPSARKAPDFTLTNTEGQQVTLSKLLAEGPVILAFFPKAFTGG